MPNGDDFYRAISAGRLEKVKALVAAGANCKEPLGSLNAVFFAVDSGSAAMVEYVVIQGADINHHDNFFGRTPVLYALLAKKDPMPMVECLAQLYANLNLLDSDRQNLLHYAQYEKFSVEISRYFL